MKYMFEAFVKDEDGAVTVDWVVITAALVALAIALIATVQGASVAAVAAWFTP